MSESSEESTRRCWVIKCDRTPTHYLISDGDDFMAPVCEGHAKRFVEKGRWDDNLPMQEGT